MRSAAVATLLLGVLACASALDVSDPKPSTGRPTCILPIKNLFCVVDTRSGFVAGLRYGYGQIGDRNVCQSSANTYQTGWNMSPTNYVTGVGPFPNFTGTATPIDPDYLMEYGSLITQVIVLEAENPYGEAFGHIPAILFRYTNRNVGDNYQWAICGNREYALFYLDPVLNPAPATPVSLKTVYNSPLSEDDTPSFLGSFEGKCYIRGSGYLGGDPHQSSKFHLLALKHVCFSKLAHIVPAAPVPAPARPIVEYNWNVPFQPCFYDKKNFKKSTSISCTLSGQTVATGKYGVIMVDQQGAAFDWSPMDDGRLQQVPMQGKEPFTGTEPSDAQEKTN